MPPKAPVAHNYSLLEVTMSDKSPRKERTFGEPWNDPNPCYKGDVRQQRKIAVSSLNPDMPAYGQTPSVKNLPSED